MSPSKKKNFIFPERRAALQQTGSIYRICCCIPDCTCQRRGNACSRGFFSLYIQAINGICFAKKHGLSYYIDFRNRTYSDPVMFNGDSNFWNYYFVQPVPDQRVSTGKDFIENNLHETYPLRIWSHSYFRTLHHNIIKHLTIRPAILTILEQKRRLFMRYRVLGIQVRRTDHPFEVTPVRVTRYLNAIRKNIKHFDKIFIATDDGEFLKLAVRSFGKEKILFNKVTRSENGEPVHANPENKNKYQLGLEVLTDCYCLSYCTRAILAHSNISYAALLINPALEYRMLETWNTRIKRFQTLLLYHLDRLGLRPL